VNLLLSHQLNLLFSLYALCIEGNLNFGQDAPQAENNCVKVTVAIIGLLTVIASIVGGVCGKGYCSNVTPSSPPTPYVPAPPTPTVTAPPMAPPTQDRSAAIEGFINNITLTSKTIAYPPLAEMGSVDAAEEQALNWLIESDPLKLNATSDQFRLQQRYALLTFWFCTRRNGNIWKNHTGWLTAEDECDWFGITCGSGELQSVVEGIALRNNNLHGGIPVDLGLLQKLKYFSVSDNSLSDSLPESIAQQWTALQKFYMSDNAMTGTLPLSDSGLP
jgi:hypothetical protein